MLNTLQYILVGDICFLSTPRSTPTRKLCSTAVFCFIITQRESHLSISLQGCQQHSEAKQQNIIFLLGRFHYIIPGTVNCCHICLGSIPVSCVSNPILCTDIDVAIPVTSNESMF